MDKKKAVRKSLRLADRVRIAMLGTIGDDGYPNIKAMLKASNAGLERIWFSTNTSSKRVAQLRQNDKACVYFMSKLRMEGLMLVGTVEIISDNKTKEKFWRAGDKQYYPLGVDDPDYSVLCFTAKWGNYYHWLRNTTFEIAGI